MKLFVFMAVWVLQIVGGAYMNIHVGGAYMDIHEFPGHARGTKWN